MIVGEDQVEAGIREALSRVQTKGVVVEGNSFLDYIAADFAIMCARAGENKLKTSARRILAKADALYLSTIDDSDRARTLQSFTQWRGTLAIDLDSGGLPIFTRNDLAQLIESIRRPFRSAVVKV